MNVTGTGVAIALAVVVAGGLLFFGANVFAPFNQNVAEQPSDTSLELTSDALRMDTQESPAIPSPLPTTLTATDVVVGTGAEATTGSTVSVNYVGMLADGTIFDASEKHGGPFSFGLGAGQVIKGWDMGVVGMKVGGKRQLIIPADLAYGNQAVGGVIPANATLIFDVELVEVK